MNTENLRSRVMVARLPQGGSPVSTGDGGLRIPSDMDGFDSVKTWVGDDLPTFWFDKDGEVVRFPTAAWEPMPTRELVSEIKMSFDVAFAAASVGGDRMSGVVEMMSVSHAALKRGGREEDEACRPRIEAAADTKDLDGEFVARMAYYSAASDLFSKIAAERPKMLERCKKMVEFYRMLPCLLMADAGVHLGCVAFVEYGVVGFGNRED